MPAGRQIKMAPHATDAVSTPVNRAEPHPQSGAFTRANAMSARLRSLVTAGILERRQYSEHPVRYEYRLTAAGRELYPVILTLMRWGDDHLAGEDGPPLVLEHGGHRFAAKVVCDACGEPVDARTARAAARAQPG
jgi:HxlR-like helix-turn-helix protein